jgi:hypothetical protein
MEITKDIFYEHETSIVNDKWHIDLSYESSNAKNKKIKLKSNTKTIEVTENGELYSTIKVDVIDKENLTKNCVITGIDGSFILYSKSENQTEGQSVIIKGDHLILSIGFTLLSIDLTNLTLNWKIRPDIAEIFEFYELDNDILLRGEIGIHRIDIKGNIKWSFSARDIWINMHDKEEVKIESNGIRLFDWESNEYLIDFNGKIIEDIPVRFEKKTKIKWWQSKK